jgi:hypothetical protein
MRKVSVSQIDAAVGWIALAAACLELSYVTFLGNIILKARYPNINLDDPQMMGKYFFCCPTIILGLIGGLLVIRNIFAGFWFIMLGSIGPTLMFLMLTSMAIAFEGGLPHFQPNGDWEMVLYYLVHLLLLLYCIVRIFIRLFTKV